jgi:hypothetical protein
VPIFRCRDKLVHYAHVPKCAGSAVNRYLAARFGPLAFQDEHHTARGRQGPRWTRTSPQHVGREALGQLFPEGFLDVSFTIVRHPVARLRSVYAFQIEVERAVAPETGFSEWLGGLEAALERDPRAFDNHIRPMDDIVPRGAHVLHLEEGTAPLVAWLDALEGEARGPREVTPVNRRSDRRGGKLTAPPARPTPADLALIGRLHARDFERFGYELEEARPRARAAAADPRGGRWRLASLIRRG